MHIPATYKMRRAYSKWRNPPTVNLLLSATVIRYAAAGPMEKLLLAPAASGTVLAAGASEILPTPMSQAGQAKHPTEMGAGCLGE
jgi:hypothetical protein